MFQSNFRPSCFSTRFVASVCFLLALCLLALSPALAGKRDIIGFSRWKIETDISGIIYHSATGPDTNTSTASLGSINIPPDSPFHDFGGELVHGIAYNGAITDSVDVFYEFTTEGKGFDYGEAQLHLGTFHVKLT